MDSRSNTIWLSKQINSTKSNNNDKYNKSWTHANIILMIGRFGFDYFFGIFGRNIRWMSIITVSQTASTANQEPTERPFIHTYSTTIHSRWKFLRLFQSFLFWIFLFLYLCLLICYCVHVCGATHLILNEKCKLKINFKMTNTRIYIHNIHAKCNNGTQD